MDLILTGRSVDASEAFAIGLANRVVAHGQARAAAEALAADLAALPQQCLRADRLSALEPVGHVGAGGDGRRVRQHVEGGAESVAGCKAIRRRGGRHGAST